MSIYVVVISGPDKDPDVLKRIKENWPDNYYPYLENTIFIAPQKPTFVDDISEKIGFSKQGKSTGFVCQIGAIQGYTSSKLWEWISRYE